MPPASPTAALRLKAQYSGPFGLHHMIFHMVNDADISAFTDAVRTVIGEMVHLQWHDTVWESAEIAAAGDSLFFPASWEAISDPDTAAPGAGDSPSAYAQWGARGTAGGRRAKLYLFEWAAGFKNNMRIVHGASALVDAITDALAASDATIGNITGESVTWKTYVNLGQNDHLTRRARG